MPVYLFWGEEEFNLNNKIKALKDKILDPAWSMLNHKKLKEPDLLQLTETLQTLPMSFGNMLIEIEANTIFLRGNRKFSSSDPLVKKLIEILENINDKVYVLFVCHIPRDSGKKIDSTIKLTKTIDKIGKIEAFNPFKFYQDKEIAGWIQKNALEKNIKISTDAALELLHNTGSNLRKLSSEIDKIALYVHPEKLIKKQDVLDLCSSHKNIFLLAEYWLQANKFEALNELHKLLETDHELKIMATLQTFIRKWIKIKSESRNKNAYEISQSLGMNKFLVEKDLQKLKNIKLNNLIKMQQALTLAESQIKTGQVNSLLALEMAISA